jgi:hypothetical protein
MSFSGHLICRPGLTLLAWFFRLFSTSDAERLELLKHFQFDPKFNCLFISKVRLASVAGQHFVILPQLII